MQGEDAVEKPEWSLSKKAENKRFMGQKKGC
jgi:hypothetical protein